MLQHEIDHLDGVLILDHAPRDQRKGALRALREGGSYSPPFEDEDGGGGGRASHREPRTERVRTVYLGTSGFAATVLRRLADSPHRPAARRHPARPAQGPRAARRCRRPSPRRPRELEIDLLQAESVNDEPALARIRAARPEAAAVCAFGQLIREPLLSELPILNVHPSLLPRWRGAAPIERAIMAGDERTGVSIMRPDRGARLGPGRPPRGGGDRRRGGLRGALRAARRARRRDAGPGPRPARPRAGWSSSSRTTAAATYAEKIEPGRAPARPRAAGRRAGPRGPRPDPARRRLPGDGRAATRLGVRRARRRSRPGGRRRASCAPRTARCCSAAARERCGSRSSSRPGAGRWRPTPTCAATRCRRMSARGRADRPRPPARLRSRSARPSSEDAFTERAFREAAAVRRIGGRERAQAQRLAYGAVQRRGTADAAIDRARRPLDRGCSTRRCSRRLRLGLYELLFADAHPRPRRRRPGGRAGQGRRRRARRRPRQRGPAPGRPRARAR